MAGEGVPSLCVGRSYVVYEVPWWCEVLPELYKVITSIL